ncbi:MAG: GGDEF domain-containing protein [Chloroflexota bacterium]
MSFYGMTSSTGARRFQARRRRAMGRALFAAGLLVAGVSVANAIGYAVARPDSAGVVVPIDAFQAALAIVVALLSRGRLRRYPGPTAFVFLLAALAVPLGTLATDRAAIVLITSSISLFPISAALFFQWGTRTHVAWTFCYVIGITIFDLAWSPTDPSNLVATGSLIGAALIGAAVGLGGQRLRDREDQRLHAREEASRSLRVKLLYQQGLLESLNDRLAEVARTDELTGLGNRRRLTEDLGDDRDRLIRYGTGLALIMLDLDHFKAFNDRYGHVEGDEALRIAATSIRSSVRPSDHVYRYGGEEFLVLLPNQGLEAARRTAERIRTRLTERALAHQSNPPWNVLTISAGVAVAEAGEGVDHWVDAADDALYRAKASGRNQTSD